jgi:hypothetical protein
VPLIKAFFDQKLTCNVRGDVELSKVKGTFGMQMDNNAKALAKFMELHGQREIDH